MCVELFWPHAVVVKEVKQRRATRADIFHVHQQPRGTMPHEDFPSAMKEDAGRCQILPWSGAIVRTFARTRKQAEMDGWNGVDQINSRHCRSIHSSHNQQRRSKSYTKHTFPTNKSLAVSSRTSFDVAKRLDAFPNDPPPMQTMKRKV